MRLPIEDVYTIYGIGTVPVGRVETGTMKPGMKVVFQPSGASGELKSIEMHHQEVPEASAGANVGFNVRGVGKEDVRRGDVLGPADNPPKVAKRFKAQIIVMQHPSVITVGYTPVFHAHTSQVACTFEQIQDTQGKDLDFIKAGDAAVVWVRPQKPVVIEVASEIPELGAFAIRDMGSTIAAGKVLEIEEA